MKVTEILTDSPPKKPSFSDWLATVEQRLHAIKLVPGNKGRAGRPANFTSSGSCLVRNSVRLNGTLVPGKLGAVVYVTTTKKANTDHELMLHAIGKIVELEGRKLFKLGPREAELLGPGSYRYAFDIEES